MIMTDKQEPGLVERNTHLLDWLDDAYAHCQHGSEDWCRDYLSNAKAVIVSQDAALASKDAEIAALRAERDGMSEFFPAHNRFMDKVWEILGREPHRPNGENLLERIKELRERATTAEAALRPVSDEAVEVSTFSSWWAASKYQQVVHSSPHERQIAWDAWRAALAHTGKPTTEGE